MKSIKSCLDKLEINDEPKLYLQIKLNYFLIDHYHYLDLSKRKEIQRIFNWLNIKSKGKFIHKSIKQFEIDKTQSRKSKFKSYFVNLNSSNFNKELTNYYYGYPPKFNLIQMQTQLRTYTGDRYLLIKIIEPIDDTCKRMNYQNDQLSLINKQLINGKRIKKNELILNIEFLNEIFSKFKDNQLIKNNLNDNFILELNGYKFKNFLVIIYALYSNQLYLNLNNLPEIIQISIDLGIEKIIKFINSLIRTNDPIYILFKLRIYLNEYDLYLIDKLKYFNHNLINDNLIDHNLFNDNSSYLKCFNSNNQMIYILNKVIINYDKLINYPGILDLKYEELNYLICKKIELFNTFKMAKRNEFDVIRAILDWYLFDKKNRENKCKKLLNKINYSNLNIKQLDKLINYFILNNYSNDIKNLLKIQLEFEIKKRRCHLSNIIDKNFYQQLLISNQLSTELIIEKKPEIKPIKENVKVEIKEIINLIKPNEIKQIKVEKNNDKFLIDNDYLKNLILIGNCSIIPSSSSIYTINQKSIVLLLGGFKSYSPYLKDQGRSMYHLIETINDNKTYSNQNIFNKLTIDDNKLDNNLNLPSVLTHDWFPLKERLPRNLAHFATIKLDNFIIIIGGLDITFLLLKDNRKLIKPISNCYLFNLLTNNWYRIKSMNFSRAYHQAIKYDNLIYVFGGLSYQSSKLNLNNTMEYYDIKRNCWSLVYDFNQLTIVPCPRMAFGMELIDNLIIITGGISKLEDNNNVNFNSLLDDFWLFNLDKKEFKKLTNLNLPRSRAAFGLIRLENELLLIGGLEINNYDLYNNILNKFNDHTIINKSNTVNTFNLTNTNLNNNKKVQQSLVSSTNTVLAIKLDHINNLDVKWFLHSKLNQQRIFPSICNYLNTILITGGKTQDHFYLKNLSIANYCSTYEVLNKFNLKWNENQIIFATFGSCLIELN